MRHSVLLLFVGTLAAHAQIASFGIKTGVPLTSAPAYAGLDEETGRWTIGLTAEFHLVSGLSVEADALTRGYSFVPPNPASAGTFYKGECESLGLPPSC